MLGDLAGIWSSGEPRSLALAQSTLARVRKARPLPQPGNSSGLLHSIYIEARHIVGILHILLLTTSYFFLGFLV